MYAQCGKFLDAKAVFDSIASKNDRTYAIMIAACVREGRPLQALELWGEMEERGIVADKFIVTSLVAACTKLQALEEGRRLHEHLIITGFRTDIPLETALLQMYAKCGSLDDAKRVFEGMEIKDLFAWSSIIAAYARAGRGEMAVVLYRRMIAEGVEPNVVTFACALGGCASVAGLADGRAIHQRILASKVPQDDVLQDSLLNMYLKCDEMVEARKVFEGMKARNVRSYTAMISAYVQAGEHAEALELFSRMSKVEAIEPNAYTFATILGAVEGLGNLEKGRKVHRHLASRGFDTNVVVQNALVTMYGKCGSPVEARKVFDSMTARNVISWTSMIAAYAQHGNPQEALNLFKRMDVEPSGVSFSSALNACALLGALDEGREIHHRVVEANLASPQMETSLLSMYARCGSLDDARRVFNRMKTRDAFSCNAMIAAFTQHGRKKQALRIYRKMEQEGIPADGITFVSVLVACSHTSLVADCRDFLQSLVMDHGVVPLVEHYLCMVDVLGRSGRLGDAEELVETMPYQADAVAWMTLLSGCKRHGDLDRGERAARKVFELAPAETLPYVFLSNMYAAAKRFDDARRVRKEMEERGVTRPVAVSYIEIDNELHMFTSGGRDEQQEGHDGRTMERVRSLLVELLEPMKQAGYVPDTREVYLEQQGVTSEEEKQRSLCFHSERLAIAYGLIAAKDPDDSRPLRVVNSHRVCSGCHSAIKLLSDITEKRIFVRDGSRFHHFEKGACSCGDHW
ncbi:putative pentatricopeptide repeat-containing protein At3g13770, mitochondrial isoform X2 [Selaginella moellendorffii]|nr:putative pentatricopeptide repeat-containing protein At3g13770, mitochondrial isoform X2 [Selaginella moellendorffii]|eukprot:XP_024522307.1 putative pentatricopeptide repeat-containing protein At3g13770, mitochondrial isoform X2 [Selaginella moellendorffii]